MEPLLWFRHSVPCPVHLCCPLGALPQRGPGPAIARLRLGCRYLWSRAGRAGRPIVLGSVRRVLQDRVPGSRLEHIRPNTFGLGQLLEAEGDLSTCSSATTRSLRRSSRSGHQRLLHPCRAPWGCCSPSRRLAAGERPESGDGQGRDLARLHEKGRDFGRRQRAVAGLLRAIVVCSGLADEGSCYSGCVGQMGIRRSAICAKTCWYGRPCCILGCPWRSATDVVRIVVLFIRNTFRQRCPSRTARPPRRQANTCRSCQWGRQSDEVPRHATDYCTCTSHGRSKEHPSAPGDDRRRPPYSRLKQGRSVGKRRSCESQGQEAAQVLRCRHCVFRCRRRSHEPGDRLRYEWRRPVCCTGVS